MTRRSVGAIVIIAACAALLSSPGVAATTSSDAGQHTASTILFSVTAASGAMTPLSGAPHRYQLTLSGVDRSTVWFADRPSRDTGILPTAEFARAYRGVLNPPNAALVLTSSTGAQDTVVLVLRSVRFDEASGILSANAQVLSPTSARAVHGPFSRHARRASGHVPAEFGHAAVFIDSSYSGIGSPSATYPTANPQIGDCYYEINPIHGGLFWRYGASGWAMGGCSYL